MLAQERSSDDNMNRVGDSVELLPPAHAGFDICIIKSIYTLNSDRQCRRLEFDAGVKKEVMKIVYTE